MEGISSYLESSKERFLEELIGLLRIPSVSTDSSFSNDVLDAASYVKDRLSEAGMDSVELCPTKGYPVVYGEKIIDPDLPTVLVYGHYDVQPADPYELWESPPFEPVVRDDKIYARGASDDKGQMYAHVKAFETMCQSGKLPCNVKFMVEGEEEIGSVHLEDFVRDNKDRLASDIILVSDTSMLGNETPSITTGLRGLTYLEVEMTGPNRDLHSGVYGGAVDNPINALCKMIASLKDQDNRITIPGFYDDVAEVAAEERSVMSAMPFNEEIYKSELEIGELTGEQDYTTWEKVSIRPTLDVNGIWGGYTGQGAKTVLPSKAYAKISMRLVPNQDFEKITRQATDHLKSIAPSTMKVKVTEFHGGHPIVTPTDSDAYRAAEQAFESTFGKKPIPLRTGGSIPVVALFEEVLGVKSILMGFGLDSDAIHSPNESFGLFNYYKGIETIIRFYDNYGGAGGE